MKKLILLFTFIAATIMNLVAQVPFCTTSNLRMRSLPCTCAKVIKVIPEGAIIYVLNYEDDEWARVYYNGYIDYVSRKYIVPHQEKHQVQYTPRYSDFTTPATSRVRYYTNTYGQRVQSPTYYQTAPAGATALCRDGTYSFSRSRRGTCSHHGGVARWL
jgi:uncharacterized protein YraI